MHRALPFAALIPLTIGLAACTPRDGAPRRATPPLPAPAPASPALPAPPPEPAPLGRLPEGVRPIHYTLVLKLAPERDRFAGTVEIATDLDRARSVVWMHAAGLTARQASVRSEGGTPVPATLTEIDPSGVAALTPARPVGPGRVTIRIDYDGAFGRRTDGLFKVTRGGKSYAFTQFEPSFARRAYPCFDEPAFRAPFDVTIFVPRGQAAIANTAEIERVPVGVDLDRVTFTTTAPLPTYLTAFAVGPLDVVAAPPIPPNAVRAQPLPLRGVAAAGQGPALSYALANTRVIVEALEGYFGVPYPFGKLDLIAVPEKRGAMENPGAITFGERLLLLDSERAPAWQQRAFASVTAHELAHIWFGDLVTMAWWDDLWLKEAAATWMSARTVDPLWPEHESDLSLLDEVHHAMDADALVSARKVRQQVRDQHDVSNAYDRITYKKGAAVISMIERWIGAPAYQRGVQAFMKSRAFGTATAEDLFAALSLAAGRDVGAPFRSFLSQPGVPLVEASLSCEGASQPSLKLKQSRYVPLGSAADPGATWQIPVCARFPDGNKEIGEACTLLTAVEGALPIALKNGKKPGACPAWVLPNADAAGYYRWSMPADELKKLSAAAPRLGVRERMSLAESVDAGFRRGTTTFADALLALAPLARDDHAQVARAPMRLLETARRWLEDDPSNAARDLDAYGQRLYAKAARDLGWAPRPPKRGRKEAGPPPPEAMQRKQLRAAIIKFMALRVRDPGVRKEAAARGRAYVAGGTLHPEAVSPDLAAIALMVAVQEGDAAFFDGLLALLGTTEDAVARSDLLWALGSARAPELATRALELSLDPRLRANEVLTPIDAQLSQPETREAAWQWLMQRIDALGARVAERSAGQLPWLAARFCDRAHADQASALFGPRVQSLRGGPRNLAGALEAVHLCAALRDGQEGNVRAFLEAEAKKGRRRRRPR